MRRAAALILALLGGALFVASCSPSIALAQQFRIDDVSSARNSEAAQLAPGTIDFSDHTEPAGSNSEAALMPFDQWASRQSAEKKFLALFPGYVEPVVEQSAVEAGQKPYTEKLYMYVAQAR